MNSDSDVIEAIYKGDIESYAHLVKRYQKMVYGIAWSRLGDADLCDEAVQDTFVKAFHYLKALRDPAKFPMWLGRIARNVSNSLLKSRIRESEKRKRWQSELLSAPANDQSPPDDPTMGDTLTKTLADLSDQHRECLVLFYMEGKNIREAAGILGISETAMKTRLHRARAALRGRLETELENSISQLGPRSDLSMAIMPLLPTASATPFGIGGIAQGVFGKSLLSASFFFWMMLSQLAVTTVFFAWLGKLEIGNLRPSSSREIRSSIVKSNTAALLLLITVVLAGSWFFMGRFGVLTVFQLGTPFCLWGLYSTVRVLRVNRSPFAIGTVIANATFFLIYVSIGFLGASLLTFLVALLPLNIVLYYTNKTRPMRHDYNLFLRRAAGLFENQAAPEHQHENVSDSQLKRFTQFLGAAYLVRDYRLNNDGVTLFLPPVKPGIGQFLPYQSSKSIIRIDFTGVVESQVSPKDFRDLALLTKKGDLQKDTLEDGVSIAVSRSLQYFLAGQRNEALIVVQAETDEEILRKSTAESSEHRYRGILSIASVMVLLIVFSMFSDISGFLSYNPPKPATQDMARDTLAMWSQDSELHRAEFTSLLNSQALPPLDFFGAENGVAYKDAIIQRMTHGKTNFTPEDALNLLNGKSLYHVIENGLLTMDELAQIGLSRESLNMALEAGGANAKLQFPQSLRDYHKIIDSRGYSVPNVNNVAYSIACLKALGCLDFIDGDSIAREIAESQITQDWKPSPGFEDVDVAKTRGLFHFGMCDFRGTRGALWTLQLLGQLDRIDQESCIEAILRFYKGKGVFESDYKQDGIRIGQGDEDRYFALESLAILNALDRIPDLHRWSFEPETSTVTKNDGVPQHGVITARAFESWAFQLRLDELRK